MTTDYMNEVEKKTCEKDLFRFFSENIVIT